MNRNRHLRYKPIIETKQFLGSIGILASIVVLARCPKCKTLIQMQQSKCKCGCNIRWGDEIIYKC